MGDIGGDPPLSERIAFAPPFIQAIRSLSGGVPYISHVLYWRKYNIFLIQVNKRLQRNLITLSPLEPNCVRQPNY